jgi:hypothetical protein
MDLLNLEEYIGTLVRVHFTDGESPLECYYEGYTEAYDNDDGIASVEVLLPGKNYGYCINVNEIDRIEILK